MVSSTETEYTSEPAETSGIQSPFCREIRSKRYYFLQQMATEEAHLRDGSGYCWCRLTMQAVGPDGEMVRPVDCTEGRECYRSAL